MGGLGRFSRGGQTLPGGARPGGAQKGRLASIGRGLAGMVFFFFAPWGRVRGGNGGGQEMGWLAGTHQECNFT